MSRRAASSLSRARVTIAVEIAAVIVFIVAALGNPVAAEGTVRDLPGAMKNDQLFKTLCIGEKSTDFLNSSAGSTSSTVAMWRCSLSPDRSRLSRRR
jgi:hypothetical protein